MVTLDKHDRGLTSVFSGMNNGSDVSPIVSLGSWTLI